MTEITIRRSGPFPRADAHTNWPALNRLTLERTSSGQPRFARTCSHPEGHPACGKRVEKFRTRRLDGTGYLKIERHKRTCGIGGTAACLLDALARMSHGKPLTLDPGTIASICMRLHKDRRTMYRALNELARAGLIEWDRRYEFSPGARHPKRVEGAVELTLSAKFAAYHELPSLASIVKRHADRLVLARALLSSRSEVDPRQRQAIATTEQVRSRSTPTAGVVRVLAPSRTRAELEERRAELRRQLEKVSRQ